MGTSSSYPWAGESGSGGGSSSWGGITGTLTDQTDLVNALKVSGVGTVGTFAAPIEIEGLIGIPFSSVYSITVMHLRGSGGPVVITASPAIEAPIRDGQILVLIFTDAVKTIQVPDAVSGDYIGELGDTKMYVASNGAWIQLPTGGVPA